MSTKIIGLNQGASGDQCGSHGVVQEGGMAGLRGMGSGEVMGWSRVAKGFGGGGC